MARRADGDRMRRPRGGKQTQNPRLIGMVHLGPLPGSPAAGPLKGVIARAVDEAGLLADAGFDTLIVENFGDAPFAAERVPPETVAAMAVVIDRIVRVLDVPIGVNVLRNDAEAALAVAAATGASFIRVNVLSGVYATDQGMVAGRAHEILRLRERLCPQVRIAADVHVKHAVPISQPDIALAAEETAYRAGADILIVSGQATGAPTDIESVRRVRQAVPDRPIWIGSGVTAGTAREYLSLADGVIVGTCLKRQGITTNPIDRKRLDAFLRACTPSR